VFNNFKYFSTFTLLLLSIFPNWLYIQKEQTNIIDDASFYYLGTTEEDISQALIANYPEWANYEQTVTWNTEPVKLGEIVLSTSFQEQFSLNSAITLVTLGESLNWQLPSNSDLYLQSVAISEKLFYLSFEWIKPENESIREQYPEITNAATYAIYAFLNHDKEKIQNWFETYNTMFPEVNVFANTFRTADASTITPFLIRPFEPPNNSFYTVNSFFDHQQPLYELENDGYKNTLHRFDNVIIQNATFSGCSVTINCYSGHDGIDYNTPLNWPIWASASGRVINIIPESNTIIIEHDNGLITYYMHLNIVYVNIDDNVLQGDTIGGAGDKGPSDGVHLHFGVRYPDNALKDIDPFGWWSLSTDPWSVYPNYGQVSNWLWKGDEAGDGYLTVDNQESQAQLFLKPSNAPPATPSIGWRRTSGYQGEAWYSFMNKNTTDYANWAIWGTTIEQPDEYVIQAYWPNDPDFGDQYQPASNAYYRFFYHENGELKEVNLYANQTLGANQFNSLCKAPHPNGNCPEDQKARFYLDAGATSIMLSIRADYDVTQDEKILFFDAIRWIPSSVAITPTPSTTITINSSITQGSNDGGINPTPCEFTLEDNEVYLGACFDGGDITSGFRFENIQVPRNANIESAYVRFTVDGEYTTPIQVQINGEASGNPILYSEASPPTNRVKTFNSTLWNITETWNLGERYNTPDLSAVIREIVIRNDWNPGQPISLIISNAGSTDVRRVIGFERAESDPDLETAELVITYNTNPTPTPTSQPPNSTPLPTATPIIIQPTFTPLPVTPQPTDPPPPAGDPWICFFCGSGCSASAQRLSLESVNPYGIPTAMPYSATPTPQVSSLRVAETIELADLLYRVRDELLNTTSEGQRLSDLYYTYIPNIVQVLISHPELSDSSFETMNLFAPSLQALLDGEGDSVTLTEEQVQGLQSFLDALIQYGDEDLQSVISAELEKHPLENFVGLTIDEAWSQINGYEFEWLSPMGNSNPYVAQQGSAIPVKFTITDFEGNFVEDETVYLQITDSNGNVVLAPIQVGNNPNNGIKIQGNQYHYNLKTKDLPVGSYTIEVFYNNGTQSDIKTITLKKK